jgi:hypothetical protein
MEFRSEKERLWNEKFVEVGTMNNILRMNLVMLGDKLKVFQNDGFNYKDRKITKRGKLWVKEGEKNATDYETEEKKQFIKS